MVLKKLTTTFHLKPENVKKFIKNLVVFSFSEGSTQLSALLISVLLARLLSLEGYGIYAVVLSTATLVTFISVLGLNTIIIRETTSRTEEYVPQVFIDVKLLFSILNVVTICILSLFLSTEYKGLFLLAALYLLIEGWGVTLLMFARGKQNFIIESILKTTYKIASVSIVVLLYFIHSQNTLEILFVLLIVLAIIYSLISFWAVRKYVGILIRTPRFTIKHMVQLFNITHKTQIELSLAEKYTIIVIKQAVLVGMASFMWLVYYKMDILLLGIVGSATAAGIYSIAYTVVKLGSLGLTLISSVLFPSLTIIVKSKKGLSVIKKYTFLMLLLGLLLAGGMYFISPVVIEILYGSTYHEAYTPAVVLSLVFIVLFPSNIMLNTLIVLNKLKTLFALTTSAAIVSITLNLLFIPRYSYFGPVYTTLITESYVFLCSYLLVSRYYKKIEEN